MTAKNIAINKRFRKFLPVVIDVETAGVNHHTDALLEIAAVFVHPTDDDSTWHPHQNHQWHVEPFEGGKLNQSALDINGIDPFHPFRLAISEKDALTELFQHTQQALTQTQCSRALLVGHNAHFDLGFIHQACLRAGIKQMPFHAFTCFDTATLAGLAYGETVLAKALNKANINFDTTQAHSALYDATVTAQLFCQIINESPYPLTR
jgi:ribonuclease T